MTEQSTLPVARGETIPSEQIRFLMPGWETTRFYTRPHETTGETVVGIQWYQPNSDHAPAGEPPGPILPNLTLEAEQGTLALEDVCWHLIRIMTLHEAGEYFVTGDGATPWNPHHHTWWVEEEQRAGPTSLHKGGPRDAPMVHG